MALTNGLTRNGQVMLSAILSGGIGYDKMNDSICLSDDNNTVQPASLLSSLGSLSSSSGQTSGTDSGLYLYVAYGNEPEIAEKIQNKIIFYGSGKNTDSIKSYPSNGVEDTTITLTNSTSYDITYYGFGSLTRYSGHYYILSFQRFETPITVAPGEAQTVELNFNVNNIL